MKPYPLTKQQARAIIDCAGNGRDEHRNRALLMLLYRAGLRVLEGCYQKLEDVTWPDWTQGAVLRVSRPKGMGTWGVHRLVAVDHHANAILSNWLAERGPEPGYLFTTATGGPVHPTHVRRVLRAAARRAGIDRRVHPHCLRHTFAHELYREGKDILAIRDALGHSSLATTERYLRDIGATMAVEATSNRESW